jgi:hypothetical protein
MLNATAIDSLEYKNDFFSIVISEAPEHGAGSYIFSSGISIPRFDPLCWGKAGICSNPAFKGLQLLRADVSAFALKRGIVTKNAELPARDTIGEHGDGWYQENALLIEDASPEAVREILEFSVTNLVRTVLTACFPDSKVPAGFLDPEAMQRFLESLSVPNYKEAAPPPIAKAS